MPKVLFTSTTYKGLSTDAKVLYGLMLDRMGLSLKNGWKDKSGRVYIIFTLNEIQEALGCRDKKATKLLNELEKEYDLIERKRLGQGKPCLIYVKKFFVEKPVERQFCNREMCDSSLDNITNQNSSEVRCNNTESNKNKYSNNNLSFLQENPEKKDEKMENIDLYESYLKKKLEYESLLIQYPHHKVMVNGLLDIMVDVLNSNRKTIRIGDEEKETEIVKSRFMKLEHKYMQYVMESLLNVTIKIRNIRQYLITSLYNAPSTYDSYHARKMKQENKENVYE